MKCAVCDLPVTDKAARINSLQIGVDGMAGNGLDVDGDPATCAPPNECEAGIDNALAFLSALINDSLVTALADGTLNYVIDLEPATTDGQPFAVSVYMTDPADPLCDFTTTSCAWVADQSAFDGACSPYFFFDAFLGSW